MSKRERDLQEEENRKATEAARREQQAQEREQRLAERQRRQQQPQQSGSGLGGLAAKVLQLSPIKRAAPSPPVPPPAYDPDESSGEAVAAAGGPQEQATRPTGVQEDQKGAGAPKSDAKLQKSKTKEVVAQQADSDLPKPAEAAASAPPGPASSLNNPFSYLRPSILGGQVGEQRALGNHLRLEGPHLEERSSQTSLCLAKLRSLQNHQVLGLSTQSTVSSQPTDRDSTP